MFTGIIEQTGKIVKVETDGTNKHFFVDAPFTAQLKIDQSVAHNGVCLTVVAVFGDSVYQVTAIEETLQISNLDNLKEENIVNLERCMELGARLDGHIVQGHVDQTGLCTKVTSQDGSWIFDFSYDAHLGNVTVRKGSITVNGVSLTVVDSSPGAFSVAIIPYTYAHTNFCNLAVGDAVNLEFDVIGKYVARLLKGYEN